MPAQVLLNLPPGEGCNYDGSAPRQESVYGFAPSDQAEVVIDEVMGLMGLPSNFIIQAANVPNAMAQVIRGERYILYDEAFMEQIYNESGDYWAQVAILAHELGHHLSGHTLGRSGSRPELELQADKFSGFVLYRLGATLEQAQSAVATLPNNVQSATHPPKSARITAIAVGYREAREQGGGVPPQPRERPSSDESEKTGNRTPDTSPSTSDNQVTLGGKTYRTVQLNGLTWMAQNLDYEVEDSWCYDNNPANCRQYGRLYTWEAAKKACEAVGWRLPRDMEWDALLNNFNDGSDAYGTLVAGGQSKFEALLGGNRNSDEEFFNLGRSGGYWSSTEGNGAYAWDYWFIGRVERVNRHYNLKTGARSCRCLRD